MNIYIHTFGCRMNLVDSEIIATILDKADFNIVDSVAKADCILLNSCSVREDGHEAVRRYVDRVQKENGLTKSIVITGCFATQLDKESAKGLGSSVKAVVTPGHYAFLPNVLFQINKYPSSLIMISGDDSVCELYENNLPLRVFEDKTTAAVIIAKGCNQKCTYCIEPLTRGLENYKSPESILREIDDICHNDYRELTLFSHCVDKYCWHVEDGKIIYFADLLEFIASHYPQIRIKYISSHPKFYSDEIIDTVCRHDNIMKVVHLPVQSGSDSVLRRMGRGYDVAYFEKRVSEIRQKCPDMSIITDIMVGFCGETLDDFEQTCQLIERVGFDDMNVFRFSMRTGTVAWRKFQDDVSEEEKNRRYDIVKALKKSSRQKLNSRWLGRNVNVLVEEVKEGEAFGRDNCHHSVIVKTDKSLNINDSVRVKIVKTDVENLMGELV